MARLRVFLLVSGALFVLAACSAGADVSPVAPTSTAVETPNEPGPVEAQGLMAEPFKGRLTVYGHEPVFHHGLPRTWDAAAVDPGAIVFYDGLFHMFYNGNDASAPGGIGYAISLDGYAWRRMTDKPVLTAADVDYAFFHVLCSSVLVEDDGTWVMYFSTQHERLGELTGTIGRATASEPTGPWVPDDVPLLRPGRLYAWDEPLIGRPEVHKTDDGYVMYYTGVHHQETQWVAWIGMATSPDGLTWTKYDDPATTDDLFRESDVILGAGNLDWEAGSVTNPHVWRMPDAWGMLYSGAPKLGAPKLGAASLDEPGSVGYATSEDGVAWTRFEGNPVFSPEDIKALMFNNASELLYHAGKYLFYFQATRDGQTADVYLATSEG